MKFDTPVTSNPIDQLRVVGKPAERIDGPAKTTGTARYAYEQHDVVAHQAYGFIVGAGIGKGRELAGIVAQQWARGVRKHLWISVSNDLKFDAERDLRDLGSGNIPVQLLGKASYSVACGVLFWPWGRGDGVWGAPDNCTRHRRRESTAP